MLSATAAPWYPALCHSTTALLSTRLSAEAPEFLPSRTQEYTNVRTKALEAERAAGVIDAHEATSWAPGPGILHTQSCADDLCDGEGEGPPPPPILDEPPHSPIVPVLAQSHGKSTAGFAGSEPRVPFRGRPPEFSTRSSEDMKLTTTTTTTRSATAAPTTAPTASTTTTTAAPTVAPSFPSRSSADSNTTIATLAGEVAPRTEMHTL